MSLSLYVTSPPAPKWLTSQDLKYLGQDIPTCLWKPFLIRTTFCHQMLLQWMTKNSYYYNPRINGKSFSLPSDFSKEAQQLHETIIPPVLLFFCFSQCLQHFNIKCVSYNTEHDQESPEYLFLPTISYSQPPTLEYWSCSRTVKMKNVG